jgi:hypothetical protein
LSGKDSPLGNGVVFPKDENLEKEKQVSRKQKLSPFRISRLVPNLRLLDYCVEAESDFIYGCFRSCVICSAIAVELSLRHTLIFSSEDWEETYWEIEMKKFGFKEILNRLGEKKGKVTEILKDADWLRKARNQIVAHPLYIGSFFDIERPGYLEEKGLERLIWATRTMVRDIKKLLQFVELDKRKAIEEKPISKKTKDGRILEEYSVGDFLNLRRPKRYDYADFLLWKAIQNGLVEEIAFLAYAKMVRIVNTLFPEKETLNS